MERRMQKISVKLETEGIDAQESMDIINGFETNEFVIKIERVEGNILFGESSLSWAETRQSLQRILGDHFKKQIRMWIEG